MSSASRTRTLPVGSAFPAGSAATGALCATAATAESRSAEQCATEDSTGTRGGRVGTWFLGSSSALESGRRACALAPTCAGESSWLRTAAAQERRKKANEVRDVRGRRTGPPVTTAGRLLAARLQES